MGLCNSQEKNIQIKQMEELKKLNNETYKQVGEQVYKFTKAKVLKVYDGDTFWIVAFHDGKMFRFNTRLYGVDTPELKGESKEKALEAKKYVSEKILNKIVDIQVLTNTIYNDKKIKDKYGRLLSIIHIDGINLANDLIDRGHGKPYFGGTK